MDFLAFFSLIVATIVAIWGIYQTRVNQQLAKEMHLFSKGLDQSIQLLYRAREAVIQRHKAHIFILHCNASEQGQEFAELAFTKDAELSAYNAELRGLAFAINDEELLRLVNEGYDFIGRSQEERNIMTDEMTIRGRSQHLHTRISQLLEEKTKVG